MYKATEEDRKSGASLFSCWWTMVQAQEELAGEPIPPESVILHFMGSGASCMVHSKHLTAVVELLDEHRAMRAILDRQRVVIEEAAQVFESGAAHNHKAGRSAFAHSQQDRADRLRASLKEPSDE